MPYLINRVGARIAMAVSEEASLYNITLQMWRILIRLWEAEPRCQHELAALTSSDPGTTSRALRSMEAKGLVSRKRPKEDAREVRVMLTPKGRELTKSIIPLHLRREALAVRGIPPSQVELAKDLLTKIYDNLAADDRPLAAPDATRRKKSRPTPKSRRAL